MEKQILTCNSIGVYRHALTRGKHYMIVDLNNNMYRIVGDHGKRVWISKSYINEGKVRLLQMQSWKFDDEIADWNLVEVTITFNNGSRRWCTLTTPDRLINYFKNSLLEPPGLFMNHLIIMKSLDIHDVEQTLKYLDSQGELEVATKPLE